MSIILDKERQHYLHMQYYINLNGRNIGPMTREQMMAYPVDANTQVSKEGGAWAPLYTYPELMQALQSTGAAPAAQESKRVVCGILAIILGGLGIQYFIIGKTSAGLITILLTLITCGLWEIVTLVQGIMMLCMSDAEFKRKYVDNPATFPLF